MSRIALAFRSFFAILFSNELPADIASAFGFVRPQPVPVVDPASVPKASDGALLILRILQRDSRIVDFLMEEIDAYSDDQIGAAVRTLHADCKSSLKRHVSLAPVIDAVEGTFQKLDSSRAPDPNRIKLIGNVPASGKVAGGILRHRGWVASAVELPAAGKADLAIVTPAELEVE